uniref:Uncharacterized protein n=1 Tax=Anguilla anguilla TaxID=7936 RepID=A0A0E9PYJ1_ANGAN
MNGVHFNHKEGGLKLHSLRVDRLRIYGEICSKL